VQDRNRNAGLFPGKEKMPVEDKLFNHIVHEFTFDRKYALKCVEDNRHNHITACYHLIDKRNRKLKDRKDNYQVSKIDFIKKVRMGSTVRDPLANGETGKTDRSTAKSPETSNMGAI
jgi:hypothetical protein